MSETRAHIHHGIEYIELGVTDLDAAKRFYRSAFGWEFNYYGSAYAGIRSFDGSEGERGGLAPTDEVRTGGTLVLLYSECLDASLRTVGAAGGTVTEDPKTPSTSPAAAASTSPTRAATAWACGPNTDARIRPGAAAGHRTKDFGPDPGLC